MKKYTADLLTLVAFGFLLAGVWGEWGWTWAAMVGGLPFVALYIYRTVGELR